VLREDLRLLFEQSSQGSLEQSLGGSLGDLFQGEQIEIERGAWIAESATGNDFSPLGGQVAEMLEVLRCW
jgi:hypothetical protein